jgi:hypothetical protein
MERIWQYAKTSSIFIKVVVGWVRFFYAVKKRNPTFNKNKITQIKTTGIAYKQG